MDRTSAELAAQVDALHPAVLRLVREAVAGRPRATGASVAVCGSLASELAAAPILIGLGVTELSAAPAAIPDLKAAIRELTLGQCRDIAERALDVRVRRRGAGAAAGAGRDRRTRWERCHEFRRCLLGAERTAAARPRADAADRGAAGGGAAAAARPA